MDPSSLPRESALAPSRTEDESTVIAFVVLSPIPAIDQKTVPEELPVSGDPYNETTLELNFNGREPLFKLNGKKLQLLQPLDRDDKNLSHTTFQVRDLSISQD